MLKANQRMAGQALRVLGMAVRESGGDPRDERELTWLGLAGLANPVRRGAQVVMTRPPQPARQRASGQRVPRR